MPPKTYEDGLIEGEIMLLKAMSESHALRLDVHTQRLSILERIIWMVSGVMIFLQTFPVVKEVFTNLGVE